MSNSPICGIYYIKNLINNKYYVGQSVNIKQRWKREKIELSRDTDAWNKHLQAAWRLYGKENFEFSIIEECLSSQLDERERYWISVFDSFNNGYNQSTGGGGFRGNNLTEEQRNKISESVKKTLTEERLQRLADQITQYWSDPTKHAECSKRSLEWWSDPKNKEKMSGVNNKNYGKKRDWWAEKYSGINSSNHKTCIQIETGKFYCTLTEASNEVGVGVGTISMACKGKIKTAGGYHWRYATEEEINNYMTEFEGGGVI